MNKKNTKAIISSTIGSIIESYDILLYLHLLPVLIPLFFPSGKVFNSSFIAVLTISITAVVRPLGSIYFGYIGDKYGRKKGLIASITFMVIPTFIISILPTYNQIYLLAPSILILCRIAQGFSVGGELGGIQTFLVECSRKEFVSMVTSLTSVSIMLGSIMATIVTYCVAEEMISWRIAFLIGIFLGAIGFYIRYNVSETAPFQNYIQNNKLLENPFRDLIKANKKELVQAFLLAFGVVVPFHVNYVYMTDFLKCKLGLSLSYIATLNIGTQLLTVILTPMFGFLADRINKKLLMKIGIIILLFVCYPLLSYNAIFPSLVNSIIIQFSLSIALSIYSGGFYSTIPLLFTVDKRYTASGFSLALGVAFFSFVSPLFLWGSLKGNLFLNTSIIFIFFGSLNLLAIEKIKPIKKF